MLILSVIAATYIVQYHEDSTAVANVVIGSFRASFHEQMNKFEHHQLKSTGEVKRIIKSKKYTKSEIQLNPPSWGLDRIDSRQGKDHQYVYPDSAGEGVTAYVFDSGINIEHDDFEGRASYGFDATGEGEVDLDGHGTHVSGILGGKSFGVAKKIKLVAVKVLDKNGEGEDINILHGLQWATRDFRKNRRKAVINMSLGGEFSQVFNDAVAATVKLGIPVVVAAGNDNIDACTESPGSEDLAITVGSTDKYDRKSKFSSYGHCVELSAPGQDIKSTYKGSSRATHTLSGTSMAAPHVVFFINLVWSCSNILKGRCPR